MTNQSHKSNVTDLASRFSKLKDIEDASIIKGGSGGPPMDTRIVKLESTVEYIKSDISDLKMDVRGLRNEVQIAKSDTIGKIDLLRSDMSSELREIRVSAKDDKKFIIGVMIAVGGGLFTAIGKGFGWF